MNTPFRKRETAKGRFVEVRGRFSLLFSVGYIINDINLCNPHYHALSQFSPCTYHYSQLLITQTFKGNCKYFELVGVGSK